MYYLQDPFSNQATQRWGGNMKNYSEVIFKNHRQNFNIFYDFVQKKSGPSPQA